MYKSMLLDRLERENWLKTTCHEVHPNFATQNKCCNQARAVLNDDPLLLQQRKYLSIDDVVILEKYCHLRPANFYAKNSTN